MKQSTVLIIILFLLTACKGDSLEVAGLTFNDSQSSVKSEMNTMGYEITKDHDGYIVADGNIEAFGFNWERVSCEFYKDELKEVTLFSYELPIASETEIISNKLEELCGESHIEYGGHTITTTYGIEEENNGYVGKFELILDEYRRCRLSICSADVFKIEL